MQLFDFVLFLLIALNNFALLHDCISCNLLIELLSVKIIQVFYFNVQLVIDQVDFANSVHQLVKLLTVNELQFSLKLFALFLLFVDGYLVLIQQILPLIQLFIVLCFLSIVRIAPEWTVCWFIVEPFFLVSFHDAVEALHEFTDFGA